MISTAAPVSARTRRNVETLRVGRGILRDPRQRRRAAAALGQQLARADRDTRASAASDAASASGDEHEDERDHDELHVPGAHDRSRPLRVARNVSSSSRCRPNISFSSSGSAWS